MEIEIKEVPGLFGFKELGGSEEVGSVFSHFRCSSKHRKKENEKSSFPFLFSLLHNHLLTSSATVNFVVM